MSERTFPMKNLIFCLTLFFTVSTTYALSLAPMDNNLKRLAALYEQRDAVAKGLHELGYKVCLNSRIGTVGRLSQVLDERKKSKKDIVFTQDGQECPPNAKCLSPERDEAKLGAHFILPLKDNEIQGVKVQFKKSQILRRLLSKEGKGHKKSKRISSQESDEVAKDGFQYAFFNRTSCLQGYAMMRGCKLLSSDRKIRNPALAKLKRKLDADKEFKARFDGEFACKVADSRELYAKKLREIQHLIDEEEKVIKRLHRGNKKAQEKWEETIANGKEDKVAQEKKERVMRKKRSVQKIDSN